jgi:hypothetical protein
MCFHRVVRVGSFFIADGVATAVLKAFDQDALNG